MTPIKRRVAAVSAPLLLALSLTACGGGPPEDASKEDFCGEVVNFEPDVPDDIAEQSPDEQADALRDTLDEVVENAKETGTPEDIPEDAREGFELTIEQAEDLDADELIEAIENDEDPLAGVSDEDQEKVTAYQEWSSEYCA